MDLSKEDELLEVIRALEKSLEHAKRQNQVLKAEVDSLKQQLKMKDESTGPRCETPSRKELLTELDKIKSIVERSYSNPSSKQSDPSCPLPASSSSAVVPPPTVISAPPSPQPIQSLAEIRYAHKLKQTPRATPPDQDVAKRPASSGVTARSAYATSVRPKKPANLSEPFKFHEEKSEALTEKEEAKFIDKVMVGYTDLFQRVGPGSFTFGGKTVTMSVKNARVLVKRGAAFVDVETFAEHWRSTK